MLTLALETSGWSGSVALFVDDTLRLYVELPEDSRTAQSLAPAIAAILRETEHRPLDLDVIAVTEGPGSFTGLRVGVTTAKTLAYATGARIRAVNTLDVISSQFTLPSNRLWAVMDAQRKQLFAATYVVTDGRLQTQQPTTIIDNQAWLAGLEDTDTVTGPGLKRLQDKLPSNVRIVEESLWPPTAISVGRLALAQPETDEIPSMELVPQYYRLSAAEEKHAANK